MRQVARIVVIFWHLAAWYSIGTAAINVSSIGPSGYFENFDTLGSTGLEHPWANDSTILGWSLFRVTSNVNSTPVAITKYLVSDGTVDEGRFYSFGAGSASDRALGGVGKSTFGDGPGTEQVAVNNNAVAGWIAVSFVNNSAATITQFTVGYDGEQWRDAGDNQPPVAQTMVFEYGIGSTFAGVPSWTQPAGNFDFISPVFTTTQGAINGNTVGLDEDLGGSRNITWLPGDTLWLRWIEWNDNAFDHGMAIDNFSFSVTAVPEPGAALFGGVACGAAAIVILIRRVLACASKLHGT
jgi:hypothetical protein